MHPDKSKWRCFQLPDNSVYYGEVGYLKDNGEVVEDNAGGSLPVVRHGHGVQIYGTNVEGVLCKYEGMFHSNKRHGQANCVFPDGSVYFGGLKWEKKHGYGKFTWADGRSYEGNWKDDRMDGNGTFKHPSGFTLKGTFRSNYYILGDLLINPLLSEQELQTDIQLQEKYKATRKQQEEAKVKAVNLHKISSLNSLPDEISAIDSIGRVSFILATQQSILTKRDVVEKVRMMRSSFYELDLRMLSVMKKEQGKEAVRRTVRDTVKSALSEGGVLLLNIDDSTVNYEELYDPDIHELYHVSSFPAQILQPLEMKSKFEIWKTFRAVEDNLTLNKNYLLVIWSKFRIDSSLDSQDILAKFEKRFGQSLPLDRVDLILCHNDIEEDLNESAI